ncbi:MAG TPA: hypothetical protein VKK79_05850 [Candidatus Lokiarchaeia archaeon]|nr:hypothetical protein [Candidatus Lokiarchaeia archaeon]
MLFQNSVWAQWLIDAMTDPVYGYARGINLFLWVGAITIMYITGIVFFVRAAKKDLPPSQVWLNRSFGLLFFLMGVTRIVFILGYIIEAYYNFLLALGYAVASLSLLPIVATFEKWATPQTKRFFTIVAIIICVIAFYFVFTPAQSALSRTIQDIGMPVVAAEFAILYIWIIKNSTGNVRKKAISTFLGALVFVVGILLDSESIIEEWILISPFLIDIAPIVFAIGVIIMGVSQKLE